MAQYHVPYLVNTGIDDVSCQVSVLYKRPPSEPTSNLALNKNVYSLWHLCLSCLGSASCC